jgi:hypothetical protein
MTFRNPQKQYEANITAQDNATIDAFGRIRVSEPFTILDTKQLTDSLPLFYDDAEISGGGTSTTYNANQASTTIAVSANTAGVRARQSKLRGTYQPGKSLLILATFVLGTTPAGVTKRVGYFDEKNGLFLQAAGSVLSFVRRTYTSGTAVDNVILQSAWNIDKMDGTGRSGITLDVTKTQIMIADLEWLGVGRVRFGFVIDGKIYYCHEILNANVLTLVYMSTPNLPVRYEIGNDGTGAASSLVHICSSVVSEGGQQATVAQTYVSRQGVGATLANQDLYTPVLSIRLKSTHIGTRISPMLVELLATTAINFEWVLLMNPTIAGVDAASWVSVTNSALEYDVSRTAVNTVTGGYRLAGGYSAATATSRPSVSGIASSYLTIGSNINGSVDQLVLAVANIDANGGTVYAGMVLDEYN